MEINAIVAIDNNGCIGYNNDLVFKSKKDLKLFKQYTSNQIVVMGSKTYSSMGSRPLPNRINVVLSRKLIDDTVLVYQDIRKMLNDMMLTYSDKSIWVIGGSEVYKYFIDLGLIDNFYITKFDAISENCDTYFPTSLLQENFQIYSVENEEDNGIKMQFMVYRKNI
jgi:dihydrofolate reductase